jgi:plastocyanin
MTAASRNCPAAGTTSVEALVQNPGHLPVAGAAVVLVPLSPLDSKNHATATVEQRGREFVPYVTIVQTGTAIDFPNNDTIRHHVCSFSPTKQFEIKLYAGKPGRPVVFDKPGEVVTGCNIHDWMEAYVLVVDSPYFAKTTGGGRAVIANVPAGRYRLQLWHPLQKGPQALREIEVGNSPAQLKLVLDVRPRKHKPRTDGDTDRY